VVPLVLVAFDTTKSPVGLALGGMWAAYALAQFPGGVIGDRFGERSALVAALAGTALGRAALAVAVVGGHTVQAVSSSLPTFLVEHRALDTGSPSAPSAPSPSSCRRSGAPSPARWRTPAAGRSRTAPWSPSSPPASSPRR